ncbi:two-component system, OmpR family, phosphate regulon sensor histidine kinase PhoR [Burkholderiales bacterium]|nr:two-component system, OmpR family, phosphate regulon sensor histidine kinase PhoR [Burkholderiales bacterium]
MSCKRPWTGYVWAVGVAAACTLAGLAMRPRFDLVNIAMVYMLGVVYVAVRHDRGAAIATAVLCVLAFDFLFVPPPGTFKVDDIQYLLTFAIMVAVALVISRLVQSVREQSRAQAELAIAAETERIRSTLLASISHDLRTPLAVIVGASSSLVDAGERLGSDERLALAKSVYEQSRDVSERVVKILELTRLEAGGLKLERDWSAPADIVHAALSRLRERMASHRVIVDVPDDLPLIRVDAALIEQALGNLLENAAKHTPPGTVVSLKAQRRNGELLVSVEDFGGGLAPDQVERVFEKFWRARPEGGAGGVGLGLAICRAIVRLHGGRVWAETLSGGATAFRFVLPIDETPPMPVEATASANG